MIALFSHHVHTCHIENSRNSVLVILNLVSPLKSKTFRSVFSVTYLRQHLSFESLEPGRGFAILTTYYSPLLNQKIVASPQIRCFFFLITSGSECLLSLRGVLDMYVLLMNLFMSCCIYFITLYKFNK